MFLTVFTPTYNRADLLTNGYNALKKQTNKNFIWLIIDDGSTDNTREVVAEWMKNETSFEIRYVYKENGGLHTGYNKAIELLDTELAVCIDSDDKMTCDAVEKIYNFWHYFGDDSVAGIVALDIYESGKIVGERLPDQKKINLIDLQVGKYKIKNGDRKIVVRCDLYKMVAPQKTYAGEKNFNPHYMHLQISKTYDFLVMNEPLCIVEYQKDGMTNNIYKQYYNSPNSFAELRKLMISFPQASVKYKLRQYIHLVSSCFISRNFIHIKDVFNSFYLFVAFPLGYLLSLYVRYKAKK